MKKLFRSKVLPLTLGLITLLATHCFAADGDIDQAEVRQDVATYAMDTVKFLVFTQTCEVTYRKVDADGNSVGEEITVLFQNIEDDIDTPEDETSTEFTQLVQAINNGNNIKTTITNAVKIKLGL